VAKEIIILSGNTTNHRLEILGGEDTWAEKGKDIKWKIKDGAKNVTSIEYINKKDGDDIFSEEPKKEDSKKWKAKIKKNAGDYDEYTYLITWKDTNGIEHTHDPKISVLPSDRIDFLNLLIGFIVALFVGFLSLKFLLGKRGRR